MVAFIFGIKAVIFEHSKLTQFLLRSKLGGSKSRGTFVALGWIFKWWLQCCNSTHQTKFDEPFLVTFALTSIYLILERGVLHTIKKVMLHDRTCIFVDIVKQWVSCQCFIFIKFLSIATFQFRSQVSSLPFLSWSIHAHQQLENRQIQSHLWENLASQTVVGDCESLGFLPANTAGGGSPSKMQQPRSLEGLTSWRLFLTRWVKHSPSSLTSKQGRPLPSNGYSGIGCDILINRRQTLQRMSRWAFGQVKRRMAQRNFVIQPKLDNRGSNVNYLNVCYFRCNNL